MRNLNGWNSEYLCKIYLSGTRETYVIWRPDLLVCENGQKKIQLKHFISKIYASSISDLDEIYYKVNLTSGWDSKECTLQRHHVDSTLKRRRNDLQGISANMKSISCNWEKLYRKKLVIIFSHNLKRKWFEWNFKFSIKY